MRNTLLWNLPKREVTNHQVTICSSILIIVEVLKEFFSTKVILQHPNARQNDFPFFIHTYAAIILYEADKLPTEALLYIKWLLERYKGCNKLFFCCSDASKIQPLTSLCTLVQLLPPSTVGCQDCKILQEQPKTSHTLI